MRILHELHSDSVTVKTRPSSDAVLLAGPLFAALALLSLSASPARAAAWASVAAFSCCVAATIAWALPRTRRYSLTRTSTLAFDPNDEGEDTFYRVDLVQDGQRVRLLEHRDVAVVLAHVRSIVEQVGLSVRPAWGVPPEYFARMSGSRRAVLRAGRVDGNTAPTQVAVARACFGASAFVFLVFVWTVLHARSVSALSVALPLFSVAFAAGVGAWAAWRRTEVVISNDGVSVFRVDCGWRRRVLEVSREELIGAFPVGYQGRELQHLVLWTTSGTHAVAMAGEAARRAAELVVDAPLEAPAAPLSSGDSHDAQQDVPPRRSYGMRNARSIPRSRKSPC